jgi:hypothetical protein
MKKLFNILILISFYIILGGRSCDDNNDRTDWQEHEISNVKDNIRSEFETDNLTEEARYAAEIKAMQDLNDLADYVEIYSDQSMDRQFREKAGEMIRGMFESEKTLTSFGIGRKGMLKPMTVGEFLENGFGNDISKMKIIFDSLRVMEPLRKTNDGVYSGRLSAYQVMIIRSSTMKSDTISQPVTIGFTSSRQLKIIGSDTLKVWKVQLGDME